MHKNITLQFIFFALVAIMVLVGLILVSTGSLSAAEKVSFKDSFEDSNLVDAENKLSGQLRWRAGQRFIDQLRGKSPPKPSPSCVDSDGGQNPDVKGATAYKLSNGYQGTVNDFCGSSNVVNEAFCNGVNSAQTSIPCVSGSSCVDGACVVNPLNLIHNSAPPINIKMETVLPKEDSSAIAECRLEATTSCYRCWRTNENHDGNCYTKDQCSQKCQKTAQCKINADCLDGDSKTFDYCINHSCVNTPFECYNLLINGKAEDKLDIVFVAEDFVTKEDFTLFEKKILLHIDALLKREPFFLEYKKLNFYLVKGKLDFGRKTGINPSIPLQLSTEITKRCFPEAEEIVEMLNIPSSNREFGTVGSKHHAITGINDPLTFIHEFGHSFALLSDEYVDTTVNGEPSPASQLGYCDAKNSPNIATDCRKWCQTLVNFEDECTKISDENTCRTHNQQLNSGTWSPIFYETGSSGYYDKTKLCVWLPKPHQFFNSRCVKMTDDINHGTNCVLRTGCYFGAGNSQYCWRSTPDSIMKTVNEDLPFSFVSVNHIKNLLTRYK